MGILSLELLKSLAPSAQDDVLQAVSEQADLTLSSYGVSNSRMRLAYFLAQLLHESGGFRIFEENLNYSAKRLTQVWPSRFPTLKSAEPYANNPQALGNKVYAGRLGNGDEKSGDGYRYRGRGFIQITGKFNYETIGQIIGLQLTHSPDLAANPEEMLAVACGFWHRNNLNPYADKADFTGLTRAINGGTVGLDDRRVWLKKVMQKLNSASIGPEDVVVSSGKDVAANERPSAADADDTLKFGSRGERVKALQRGLKDLGYQPGAIDGIFGSLTAREVLAFQFQNELETTGVVGNEFWKAMDTAKPLALEAERITATKEDLKALGSQTVIDGDRTTRLGWIASALGALGIGNSAVVSVAGSTGNAAGGTHASPDNLALIADIANLIPKDVLANNEALRKFTEGVVSMTGAGGSVPAPMKTIFDLLPGFFESGVMRSGASGLATIAASVLPGFGGSALIGAAGVLLSILGKRVVAHRLRDHQTGANTAR